MTDPNPSTDRTYVLSVPIVVGSRDPLTPQQRKRLGVEVQGLLAIHLDIPGTLRFIGNPVTGSAYIAKVPAAKERKR